MVSGLLLIALRSRESGIKEARGPKGFFQPLLPRWTSRLSDFKTG